MVMYLVLGCLMDAMAMIILTVPIIFPVIAHLGFDPIWFGAIIVMTVELGLIPSAGRHERLCHQECRQGRFVHYDFQGRDPLRRHRHRSADHTDRISFAGDLAAAAYDGPVRPLLG